MEDKEVYNLKKLLSNPQEKKMLELTEEDFSYLNEALHTHKRSEVEYLMKIKDVLTEERFFELKKHIEERHRKMIEKLFGWASD